MAEQVVAAVLIAYASLVVELAVLRVSSVASSLNILRADAFVVAGYSEKYRKILARGKAMKLLLSAPLVVVYALYAYPLVVIALGPDPLGDYVFSPGPAAGWAGIGLIVFGRGLAVAAALSLRRHARSSLVPLALEVSGPFRWSRNPGLVGMYAFVVGMWLTMPSAGLAAAIVVYVVHMDVKVRMEEDFLTNTFGRSYADYRMRTGRYLPCIGPCVGP
jgi:protein-S-isoprenylcysteine O-methyltransferase Ste14